MIKRQRVRTHRPKKKTGKVFLLIAQLIVMSPVIVIWLWVAFTSTEPFLISNYWQQHSKGPIALVAVSFAWIILTFDMGKISNYLAEHTFGIFLIKIMGYLGIGILFGLIFMYFTLPIAITRITGVEYQEKGIAQRTYSGGGRGCHYYLRIRLKELNGSVCIGRESYNQLSDQPFNIEVTGKKSKVGMIIKRWSFAENQ